MTNTPDRRPSNFPPPVADDTFGPPEPRTPDRDEDTRRVAKNSAVGTLVALGVLAVVAAVVIPIVMHVQSQAAEEEQYREDVSDYTEDLIDQM